MEDQSPAKPQPPLPIQAPSLILCFGRVGFEDRLRFCGILPALAWEDSTQSDALYKGLGFIASFSCRMNESKGSFTYMHTQESTHKNANFMLCAITRVFDTEHGHSRRSCREVEFVM